MPAIINHRTQIRFRQLALRDLSDVYTWSFPEFLPFCLHLFYYSTFKAFRTLRGVVVR